jgi:hypothetical protein
MPEGGKRESTDRIQDGEEEEHGEDTQDQACDCSRPRASDFYQTVPVSQAGRPADQETRTSRPEKKCIAPTFWSQPCCFPTPAHKSTITTKKLPKIPRMRLDFPRVLGWGGGGGDDIVRNRGKSVGDRPAGYDLYCHTFSPGRSVETEPFTGVNHWRKRYQKVLSRQ